ncbi:MAG: FtsX-like permease family protein, partial [Nitrospirales bacterium]|nr:FtsX-like permease family protein [Nitrospirales bacterium]
MATWLNRQRNIMDFTLSSLWRRKGKNLGLLLVFTLIVFLLSSVMFFTYAIKREAAIILKDAPEIVVQRIMAGRHDLIPASYAADIGKIRGVVSVKERHWGYYFDPIVGANYTFMAPDTFTAGKGKIAIGNGISRARLAYAGDIMPFKAFDGKPLALEIKEVLSSESELVSSDLVLLSVEDYRQVFGIPEGYATDISVTVRNQKEIPTIARKITELHPDTRPIMRDEILRTYDSLFTWRGGLMIVILTVALICFTIFAWDRASGLSAEEKREIGILKAVGWETSDILLMKSWEGAVISLSAFLLGTTLAYIHVFFGSAGLFEPVLKGWST